MRLARPAAVVAAGLLLVGCSGSGALVSTDGEGVVVCSPQESGTGRAVITVSAVRVEGGQDVTLVSASLVDAEGLDLVGYDVGAEDQDGFAVVGDDYEADGPPEQPGDPVLAHGRSYLLKVGLQAGPDGGSAAAVELEYTTGGSTTTRTVQTLASMQVAAAGAVCSAS